MPPTVRASMLSWPAKSQPATAVCAIKTTGKPSALRSATAARRLAKVSAGRKRSLTYGMAMTKPLPGISMMMSAGLLLSKVPMVWTFMARQGVRKTTCLEALSWLPAVMMMHMPGLALWSATMASTKSCWTDAEGVPVWNTSPDTSSASGFLASTICVSCCSMSRCSASRLKP